MSRNQWGVLLEEMSLRVFMGPETVLLHLEIDPMGPGEVRARLSVWQDWKRDVSTSVGEAVGPWPWVADALVDLVNMKYPINPEKED